MFLSRVILVAAIAKVAVGTLVPEEIETCLTSSGSWTGSPLAWTYDAACNEQSLVPYAAANATLRRLRIAVVGDSTSREVYRHIVHALTPCGHSSAVIDGRDERTPCDLPPKFNESTFAFPLPSTKRPKTLSRTLGNNFVISYFGLQQLRNLHRKPWFQALFWFVYGRSPEEAQPYVSQDAWPKGYASPPVYDVIVLNAGLWNLRHDKDVADPTARLERLVQEADDLVKLLTSNADTVAEARRIVVWRTSTLLEYVDGVTVPPFTAYHVAATNTRIARIWRAAGFAVLDAQRFSGPAPSTATATGPLIHTKDGIHVQPWVNAALGREILSLLALRVGDRSDPFSGLVNPQPKHDAPHKLTPARPSLDRLAQHPFEAWNVVRSFSPPIPSNVLYTLVWLLAYVLYIALQRTAAETSSSSGGVGRGKATAAALPSTPAPDTPVVETPVASQPIMSVDAVTVVQVDAVSSNGSTASPAAAPAAKAKPVSPVHVYALVLAAVAIVLVTLACLAFDKWRWMPVVERIKPIGTDMYIVFVVLVLLVATRLTLSTAPEGSKSEDVLMSVPVTEETKGWMMLLLLFYHYYDVKAVYNFMRMLVAGYLWMTGYGNTLSLMKTQVSLAKFSLSFLRLNLLCAAVSIAMQEPWMLYYICPLHTVAAAITMLIHMRKTLPAWARYAIAGVVITTIWHARPLFDAIFTIFYPLLVYRGSLYEWWFRTKLDCYATLIGCIVAEYREYFMPYLTLSPMPFEISAAGGEKEATWRARARMGAIACTAVACMAGYAFAFLGMADRRAYNVWHPYLSPFVLTAFVLLRGSTSWLRRTHSRMFAFVGRHSLELYLLQFHVWLTDSARANVVPLPSMRFTSLLLQSALFLLLAVVGFNAVSLVLAPLRDRPNAACIALLVSVLALTSSAYFDSLHS